MTSQVLYSLDKYLYIEPIIRLHAALIRALCEVLYINSSPYCSQSIHKCHVLLTFPIYHVLESVSHALKDNDHAGNVTLSITKGYNFYAISSGNACSRSP